METAETQAMDPSSQVEDASKVVTALNEQILQIDEVTYDQRAKQASSLIPAAADQDMQHGSNTDFDKHSLQEMDKSLDEVDQRVADVCQQIGDEEIENHTLKEVPVEDKEAEKMAGKSAKGDGGHSAVSLMIQEEAIDIQEDDLIRTVIEVLEARHLIETRPIPVLVKGKEVDLVRLSFQVRACGGYDQVTLWSSISKTLGFGADGGPLLKLVYVKYLKSLEHRRLIANQDVQVSQSASKREIEDNVKSESAVKSQSRSRGVSSTRKRSREDGSMLDNSVTDISKALFTEGSESFVGVLEWMKRLAVNPGDSKKGKGSRVSRWSEAWAGRCETLAAKMREILWNKDEHPLHDLTPLDSQDQESVKKNRGRGQAPGVKDSGKKAHRLSS